MRTKVTVALLVGLNLHLGVAEAQEPSEPAPSSEEPASAPSTEAETTAEPPAPQAEASPPTPAVEPEPVRDVAAGMSFTSAESMSVRVLAQNTLILPGGDLELGGEMTVITSSIAPAGGEALGVEGLSFTDVGLVLLQARYSFGPVELGLATNFLVKQPSYMDEWVPQAGTLTTRVALGLGQALSLQFSGGPLLEDKGIWEGAALALQAKRSVHETVVFEGALGGTFMHLNFADPTEQTFWFSEVVVGAKAILRTPFRAFAAWVEADLHFPVAGNPDSDDPDPTGFLDPHTRLNFNLGAAYMLVDKWDLYARLDVVDRGGEENPESMLPILNGGFDQQQITLGLQYRWELGKKLAVAR